MGGALIISTVALSTLLWADLRKNKVNLKHSVGESHIDRAAAV